MDSFDPGSTGMQKHHPLRSVLGKPPEKSKCCIFCSRYKQHTQIQLLEGQFCSRHFLVPRGIDNSWLRHVTSVQTNVS